MDDYASNEDRDLATYRSENARLSKQLQRARDAIAVLYVGTKARKPDGRVDVDQVINGVLGDP